MKRRDFLKASAAGLAAAALPATAGTAAPAAGEPGRRAVFLVPGYRTDLAAYRGAPVDRSPEMKRHFPKDFDAGGTLVTRIDEGDGTVRRALMPIFGHKITVSPDGRLAFWNSMNGLSLVSFDPATLEMGVYAQPRDGDHIGGGHAVFTPDGGLIVATERKMFGDPHADPRDQYGLITLRDPQTLRVVESYSSHGVAPHAIALFDDGRHVAVAHYGTMNLPRPNERPVISEPSLCVLELAGGRLVRKWTGDHPRREVRHLAVGGLDRIAAILTEEGSGEDMRARHRDHGGVYEPDLSVEEGYSYLPAPVRFFDAAAGTAGATSLAPDPMDMRQGQSMVYDPVHNQVIATFTSSHTVGVFDGASGALARLVRTGGLGLRYPRGVVLHPDGVHYVVSASWGGLFHFRRGDHGHVAARDRHDLFFDHSHLSVLAA
ncbi:MAG: DUF1513 domain-containing protein [Hyphomicrobiales bacterium]|nr:DUF1513 domain-containing protein [Hyphomicrobiales bacterium]MCP5373280.1 DUF1513 domain-containing protein [Hyphomicrobiales bacterium]